MQGNPIYPIMEMHIIKEIHPLDHKVFCQVMNQSNYYFGNLFVYIKSRGLKVFESKIVITAEKAETQELPIIEQLLYIWEEERKYDQIELLSLEHDLNK